MNWLLSGAFAAVAVLVAVGATKRHASNRILHAHPTAAADEQAWADLVARLEGPTIWCATCGQPTADDCLWCDATCQTVWEAP